MTGSPFWRLVWKEYRTQRAFWLSMVGLTFLLQLLLMSFSEGDPDSPPPLVKNVFAFALFFAALYALGCGATLFATERETGTYEFQRAVPVSWFPLFAAKTTFAVLSTLAILAVLLVLAAGLSRWHYPDVQSAGEIWALFGFGAVELLLWGILFSLVVDQPLVAVILAISTVPTYVHLLAYCFGSWQDTGGYVKALPVRIAIAAAVGVADVLLARRWLHRGDKPLAVADRGRGTEEPAAGRMAGPEPLAPCGEVLFRRLLWQQWRQSRRVMLVIALAVVPLTLMAGSLSRISEFHQDGGLNILFMLVSLLTGLMGCCVFLGDQRREQFRFFAEHGARPGYVWLTRQAIWIAPAALLALLALPLCLMAATVGAYGEIHSLHFEVFDRYPPDYTGLTIVLVAGHVWELMLCAAMTYAAGQFCSMLLRSGILAVVFGLMLGAALLGWTYLVRLLALNTLWAAAPIPLVLLVATRLRTNDWILQRNSLAAWLRVGTVVLVPAAAILVAVPVMRVRSVPVVEVGLLPGEYQREPTAEEQTTAAMYQRARDAFKSYQQFAPAQPAEISPVTGRETAPDPKAVAAAEDAWAKANEESIAILLAATARPLGDVRCPPRLDYLRQPKPHDATLNHLLVASARLAQREGRLDDAMQRYLAALRLWRYARCYDCIRAGSGDWPEFSVYEELPKWALLPGQTPGRIAAMLKELGQLIPTFPSRANAIKAEYVLARDVIDQDPDALQAIKLRPQDVFLMSLCARWYPWEVARARRVLDVVTDAELAYCRALEFDLSEGHLVPVQAYPDMRWRTREWQARRWQFREGLPTSCMLPWPCLPYLRQSGQDILAVKTARAVVQLVLGLEAWRLAHGRLPDSLEALAGTYLEHLPVDPSSGWPFRYFRDGLPFDVIAFNPGFPASSYSRSIPAGTPLLASSSVDLTLGESTFRPWQPWHQRASDIQGAKVDKWYAKGVFALPYPGGGICAERKIVTAGQEDVRPRDSSVRLETSDIRLSRRDNRQ